MFPSAEQCLLLSATQCCPVLCSAFLSNLDLTSVLTLLRHHPEFVCLNEIALWKTTPFSSFLIRSPCHWFRFYLFHLPVALDLGHYVSEIFTAIVLTNISSLVLMLCAVPMITGIRLNAARSQPPTDTWMPAANHITDMVDVVIKLCSNDGVCNPDESAAKIIMILLWPLNCIMKLNHLNGATKVNALNTNTHELFRKIVRADGETYMIFSNL